MENVVGDGAASTHHPTLAIRWSAGTTGSQKFASERIRRTDHVTVVLCYPNHEKEKTKIRRGKKNKLKKKNGHSCHFGYTEFEILSQLFGSFCISFARPLWIECTNSLLQCIKNYLWPLIKSIGKTNSYSLLLFSLDLFVAAADCHWIARLQPTTTTHHNPIFEWQTVFSWAIFGLHLCTHKKWLERGLFAAISNSKNFWLLSLSRLILNYYRNYCCTAIYANQI